MKTRELTEYLNSVFRPELQENYDNSGFLLGDGEEECNGVLVAIDLTEEVIEEAKEKGLNLIVTHHPFIFGTIRRLTPESAIGRMVRKLIKEDIAVYAAHTNLDNLPWGVNGALAEKIGIEECTILKPQNKDANVGAGIIGRLKEAEESDEFIRRVKHCTGIPIVRVSEHDGRERIERVAICGGSGSFLIKDAEEAGADIYLTADLKYHDFQKVDDGRTAEHRGMILADIGHYESEQYAKDVIFHKISEKFSNFACCISEKSRSIVHYI